MSYRNLVALLAAGIVLLSAVFPSTHWAAEQSAASPQTGGAKPPDTIVAQDKKGRITVTEREVALEFTLRSFDFEQQISWVPEDEKAALRQRLKIQALNDIIDERIRGLEAAKLKLPGATDSEILPLIPDGISEELRLAYITNLKRRIPGDRWMTAKEIPTSDALEDAMVKLRKQYGVKIVDPDYQDRVETGLKWAMPEATHIGPMESKLPVYKAYKMDPETQQSKLIGYVWFNLDVDPKMYGYHGPIKYLIGMDLNGKVTGIRLYSHKEPGNSAVMWLNDPATFKKFVGKSVWDPWYMRLDIDAVAQASITVQSTGKSVRETGRKVAQAFLTGAAAGEGFKEEGVLGTGIVVTAQDAVSLAVLVAILGMAFASFRTKNLRLRYATLASSVVFIGFVKSGLLSIGQMVNMIGSLTPPPVEGNLFWWILTAFTVLTLILAGRVYCGSICPFGALQDFITAIVPQKWRLKVPWKLHQTGLWIKYAALAGMFVGFLFFNGDLTLTEYEPFDPTFQGGFGPLMGAFLAFLFIAAVFIPRFFCRYLCGLGALLGVATVIFPWQIKRVQQCTHCKICMKGCPVGAIDGPKLNRMECVRCDLCERNLIEQAGACRKPARAKLPEGGVRRELPMAQG